MVINLILNRNKLEESIPNVLELSLNKRVEVSREGVFFWVNHA